MTLLINAPPQQLAAPRRLRALGPSVIQRRLSAPSHNVRRVLEVAEQYGEASRELTRARKLAYTHPSAPTAWSRLAQAEMVENHRDGALSAARSALSAQAAATKDTSAQLVAALTLASFDATDEAETALTELEWRDGPSAVLAAALAVDRGDYAEARERLSDQDSASAWNLRGWIALHETSFREAIRSYRQAIRRTGPTPESLANIGLSQAALGRLDKAIAATRQSLALQPSQRERVVFNLATYLVSNGDTADALAVVTDLLKASPSSEATFVLARLHLAVGDAPSALRVLRRTRTQLWASLDDDSRAELEANIAFVRWQLGQLSADHTADELITALKRTDYTSRRIASLIPLVLTRFSHRKILRNIVAHVRERHGNEALYDLDTYLAILEGRFEDAIKAATEWSHRSFLDPEPAVIALYLMCDVTQEYERAVTFGASALQRMPAAQPLRHNVSYALALAGYSDDARRCQVLDVDAVRSLATEGLVLLQEGDMATAESKYRQALDKAQESPDATLPILVEMHARFAFSRFAQHGYGWSSSDLEPNPGWLDEPRVAVASAMLEKVGVPLPEALLAAKTLSSE